MRRDGERKEEKPRAVMVWTGLGVKHETGFEKQGLENMRGCLVLSGREGEAKYEETNPSAEQYTETQMINHKIHVIR